MTAANFKIVLLFVHLVRFIWVIPGTDCSVLKIAPNNGRIIGGQEVRVEDFPHQISLQIFNRHVCGGSIISSDIILTAGHCVTRYTNPNHYTIRAGSSYHQRNGQVIRVKSLKAHPSLNKPSFGNNDIAVIKLATSLSFSAAIRPIALMNDSDILADMTNLNVSGWGLTNQQVRQPSPVLRYTQLNNFPQRSCEAAYASLTPITANMMCAGAIEGGRGTCQGDSGGPLVGTINNATKLVGVVSFGLGCATANYPTIYTRVQNYNAWINQTIREFI